MLKQALRRLRGTPAFTGTAILLFALSLATAAAIGGLLEAVVLRPLPFRDPGVAAGDAGIFALALLLLVLVAVASSWIAARRAGGVAPMEALRGV